MLENIHRLLHENEIDEAIRRLELFLKQQKGASVQLDHLYIIWSEYNDLQMRHLRGGAITDDEWRREQRKIKEKLLEFLRGLEQQTSPTRSPVRPKGGILNRALDAIRKRWQRPKARFPERPPSPRIPSKVKEQKDMASSPVEPDSPNESAPIPEEPEEVGSPPPTPAPQAPSAPAAPTQTGGTQNPFQRGKILYAIPSNMKLAEAVRCRVRIATESLADSMLEAGLSAEEQQNATREGIQITSVMKVELAEAKEQDGSFEIVSRNTAEQPILPFMPTEWAFDVTPKRPGHYALLLRVTAKVQIPGFGERPFDVAVLDRAIQVTTTGEAVDLDAFEEQPIPDPTWDDADEQAVHQALLVGRVDRAIERIINFVQDKDREFHNTLLLLQFRWSDNSNQLQQQLITTSDWDKVNNRVRLAITKLLTELRQNFSSAVTTTTVNWKTLNADLQTELES